MEVKAEEKKIYAKLHSYSDQIEFKDLSPTPCDYILRCIDGPYEGKQIGLKELGDEIIIGSDASCNFSLNDETISRQHCKLTCVPNTCIYLLEDLKSESGTWLKISSLEDCYEISESTQFKLFDHTFEIIFIQIQNQNENNDDNDDNHDNNINNNKKINRAYLYEIHEKNEEAKSEISDSVSEKNNNDNNTNNTNNNNGNPSSEAQIIKQNDSKQEAQVNEKTYTHLLKFLSGSKEGYQLALEGDCSLTLGKKGSEIELNLPCSSENHFNYKILKSKNRIFIVNCCEEITEKGLFYRLSSREKVQAIVRGGDIIRIGKSIFRILTHNWAFFSEIGDRIHQEDKHCIIDDLRLFDEMVIPYYAVYDGHGGVSCSLFLQKHLHNNLRELIRSKNLQENSKNFFEDLCTTIQEAVIYTDIHYYETENTSIHHGSTCVFVFFIGNKILCCNLGDSIAILVKNDEKIYLSRDFRPMREKEKGRIESRKGYVTSDGRLLGVISVSRGFGDWKFKDPKKSEFIRKTIANKALEFDEYLISNRAEFRIIDFDPLVDKYIIIVSDGIFQYSPSDRYIYDVIDKHLAADPVKKEFGGLKNIPNIVDNVRLDLINNIYSDPSTKGKADNMTLILLYLQK